MLGDVSCEAFQKSEAKFWSRLFTSTEHDGDLDLGSLIQESDHVTLLRLVIVIIDLGTKLLLLDHSLLLVLTSFAGLLVLLVLELAEVHDLDYGWLRVRCNLDQVEICIVSQLACVLDADDACLLTIWTYKTYLGNPDTFVDANFSADVYSSSSSK